MFLITISEGVSFLGYFPEKHDILSNPHVHYVHIFNLLLYDIIINTFNFLYAISIFVINTTSLMMFILVDIL